MVIDDANGDGPLDGPVAKWVETLSTWASELSIDGFIFWPPDTGLDQIERFANEVVPSVKERISVGRQP